MNRKTKISAISALATAGILVGLMIMIPFLISNTAETNGLAVFFMFIVGALGDIAVYASAVSFTVVALVFAIRILTTADTDKQRSYNKRILIAACVLLPFLAVGIISNAGLIYPSKLGLFPLIYTIIVAVAYAACLIAQIVSLAALKHLK